MSFDYPQMNIICIRGNKHCYWIWNENKVSDIISKDSINNEHVRCTSY